MDIIGTSSVERPTTDPVPSRQRSRITNGKLLPGDNRGPWARRCKDLIAEHLSDLGGVDNTSAAERSIVRRIGVLSVELEQLEAKFAMAGQADARDLDLYQRTAGNLRRLLESIGLQRRSKDVSDMSLSAYTAARHDSETAVGESDAETVVGEPASGKPARRSRGRIYKRHSTGRFGAREGDAPAA